MTARAELDRKIEALYANLQPEDVLRTIPGVGRRLAPVLFGLLHSANRFRSERHIRGFCGLFTRRSDSEGAERPRQRITQGGNDRIKRALMLATDTARKIDPDLAEVYWRLMTAQGHHHKQALCAVANRLVNRIFSVLRSGRPYILRDHDGREISVAEAKALVAACYQVPEAIRATRRANRAPIAS
jgi:transposase